ENSAPFWLPLASRDFRVIGLSSAVRYFFPIRNEFEMGTILAVVAKRALLSCRECRALFGLLDVGLRGSVATFAADRHAIGALRPRLKSAGHAITGRVARLADRIDVRFLGNQRLPGLRMARAGHFLNLG